MNVSQYNSDRLNLQAAALLRRNRIPFDPATELAALALIREAVDRNLVVPPAAIPEPALLVAKLQRNPALAMSLMTESEPGVRMAMDLPEALDEAAAMLLEELTASLTARVPLR
jgi:hypothetical protein